MYDICGGRWNKTDAEPPRTTLKEVSPRGARVFVFSRRGGERRGVLIWKKRGVESRESAVSKRVGHEAYGIVYIETEDV
jgi:hypothetical protein